MKILVETCKLTCLLIAVAIFGLSQRVAADPVQEVTTGIKSEKKSFFSLVDLSASYQLVTDLNQDVSPRTYYNEFDLTASREIANQYIGSVTAGFQFVTLDSTVTRSNGNDDYFKFNDVNLDVLKTFRFAGNLQSLSIIANEDILTSEDSRYLGYKTVTYGQAVATTHVNHWFSLKNSVNAGYIWNTYKYSPISYDQSGVGDIMADGFYGYNFTPLFRILPNLIISMSLGVRGTHFMDGTNTYDFGNSYLLSYSFDNWSIYAHYINRGWTDRGETNLWFVDEYRRLADLGVSVNF